MTTKQIRCSWVNNDPLYIEYHDHEWGVPIYHDSLLFEFLILEGMQAGLSWLTVLKKRKNFRACFDQFNINKIAQYDKNKINLLLTNPSIIRNQMKIEAAINNAKVCLQVQKEWNTFTDYIWQFTEGKTIQNRWENHIQVPSFSNISDRMSKVLKQHGFKFVGTTICYAFMQAVGMVNDHTTDCFRHQELKK